MPIDNFRPFNRDGQIRAGELRRLAQAAGQRSRVYGQQPFVDCAAGLAIGPAPTTAKTLWAELTYAAPYYEAEAGLRPFGGYSWRQVLGPTAGDVATASGTLAGSAGVVLHCNLTAGSATVTVNESSSLSFYGTFALAPGQPVSGTGVPAGATVQAIHSTTSLTLSAPATANGSAVALTFAQYLAAFERTRNQLVPVGAPNSTGGVGVSDGFLGAYVELQLATDPQTLVPYYVFDYPGAGFEVALVYVSNRQVNDTGGSAVGAFPGLAYAASLYNFVGNGTPPLQLPTPFSPCWVRSEWGVFDAGATSDGTDRWGHPLPGLYYLGRGGALLGHSSSDASLDRPLYYVQPFPVAGYVKLQSNTSAAGGTYGTLYPATMYASSLLTLPLAGQTGTGVLGTDCWVDNATLAAAPTTGHTYRAQMDGWDTATDPVSGHSQTRPVFAV
jgi:hypothetical protein